jgi:hypothetical protein
MLSLARHDDGGVNVVVSAPMLTDIFCTDLTNYEDFAMDNRSTSTGIRVRKEKEEMQSEEGRG